MLSNSEELQGKIRDFMRRKSQQYPDLTDTNPDSDMRLSRK
jgi:hypothetical protein